MESSGGGSSSSEKVKAAAGESLTVSSTSGLYATTLYSSAVKEKFSDSLSGKDKSVTSSPVDNFPCLLTPTSEEITQSEFPQDIKQEVELESLQAESSQYIKQEVKLESVQAEDIKQEVKSESSKDICSEIKSESPLTLSAETSIPEGMSPRQWKVALRRQRKAIRREEAA